MVIEKVQGYLPGRDRLVRYVCDACPAGRRFVVGGGVGGAPGVGPGVPQVSAVRRPHYDPADDATGDLFANPTEPGRSHQPHDEGHASDQSKRS